jgi:thiol:disulfide interchange protein DsbD
MRAAVSAGLLLVSFCALAQKTERVRWNVQVEPAAAAPGGKVLARATADVEPGWHLYSASTAGGMPTSFQAEPSTVVGRLRTLQPPPKRALDPNFNTETETYEGQVTFLLELDLKKDAPVGATELTFHARFQTCNDRQCVPGKWTGTAPVTVDRSAQAAAPAIPAGYAEAKPPAAETGQPAPQQSWGAFLLVAFGFGLASIFTPCVFPMIPITMSYFLNRQSGGRGESIRQAVIFCLGIIVLFSGLGLVTTAILGPVGVKQLASSPWVNGFITALFMAFGLSLLGAFEITIPSSILTRLNQSSEKGGFVGTLLMGLTFSLASFACVGPFVGTLLAASVSGGGLQPLVGMVTFAAGLALPFFFLAIFPSYLKRLPRSGGWMARVKVVMGFVILAASLKYLASLDQVLQWGFLTRERFLAAWMVLFAMAGLYLLGFLRLEGIKPDEKTGLWRLLIGMAFLMFAISLAPGMFGGKLGDLDAYVPPAAADATLAGGGGSQTTLPWMTDDYRGALERARREGKLLFVDFTGVTCTNCHWMRANMFTRPEIVAALGNFVLVELYTDRPDAVSEANQQLQLAKFNTVAEPFYAILSPDEKAIATFDHLTRDPQEFLAFLQKGAAPSPAAAPVEAAAPSGSLPRFASLDGGSLDAAEYSGKVVVVNFWATWCVPCIQEIPSFNKIFKEFGPKGVVVMGISMDEEGAERVRPFLKKHPMDYTVGLGSDALTQQFGLDQLPVTVVFDRAGKQVKRFEGFLKEDELQAAVQAAL